MPIGTVTMILANVGMQIYNNWCNGRQNEQLQQMREEFEQAARERQTERMWQLMREGQELTMQLEEEKHQQRIDELKNDVGDLLLKLAYENAINNWPLNVLPIVMKNQALGNLLANQEESIALHCILAPSNCPDFNKYVYSAVEKELEQYCNLYWSSNSGHPILFYSGAWRGNDAPNGMQIESMQTALSNLPTLLITPFFRPSDGNLVIQLRIWGVDAASNDNGMLSDLYEFEPSEKEFQREYNKQLDFASEEGLIEDLVEDLVPYLQCLIGYMADTYFWSSSGLAPLLPHLLVDGSINTDGMKYLVSNSGEYYERLLLTSKENAIKQPFANSDLLNLYKGGKELWDKESCNNKLEHIFISYCEVHYGGSYNSIAEAIQECPFTINDIPFISSFIESSDDVIAKKLKSLPIMDYNNRSVAFQDISLFDDCRFVKTEVGVYDIIDTINAFKRFVNLNRNMIPLKDPALYIEENEFTRFKFHICDPDSKQVLLINQGFDYMIKCERLKHQKQLKTIFRYQKKASKICRYSRIDIMINTIENNDLIY